MICSCVLSAKVTIIEVLKSELKVYSSYTLSIPGTLFTVGKTVSIYVHHTPC